MGISFVGNCFVWRRKKLWLCDINETEIFFHVVRMCCSVKIYSLIWNHIAVLWSWSTYLFAINFKPSMLCLFLTVVCCMFDIIKPFLFHLSIHVSVSTFSHFLNSIWHQTSKYCHLQVFFTIFFRFYLNLFVVLMWMLCRKHAIELEKFGGFVFLIKCGLKENMYEYQVKCFIVVYNS